MKIVKAGYKFIFSKKAGREFDDLDKITKKRINTLIIKMRSGECNPFEEGKKLSGKLDIYYSFRIGNYRMICELYQGEMIVIAIAIAHRKDVYKKIS